jgi:hypothetical protein
MVRRIVALQLACDYCPDLADDIVLSLKRGPVFWDPSQVMTGLRGVIASSRTSFPPYVTGHVEKLQTQTSPRYESPSPHATAHLCHNDDNTHYLPIRQDISTKDPVTQFWQ